MYEEMSRARLTDWPDCVYSFCFINSNFYQASSLTVLSHIEKREKKEVMGKLHEMENELKVRVRLQTPPYFATEDSKIGRHSSGYDNSGRPLGKITK